MNLSSIITDFRSLPSGREMIGVSVAPAVGGLSVKSVHFGAHRGRDDAFLSIVSSSNHPVTFHSP